MVAATSLAERIANVRQRVAEAARAAGRDPAAVAIVAVSKTVGREAVDEAYRLGLRQFGENRVQDAAAKFAAPLPGDASLHLIGHLQSNKARAAARLFDLIESVDRLSVIEALAREGERLGRPIPVLLQVNVAREPQKAGCPPEAAADLVDRIEAAAWLELRGLMTIAPLVEDPEATRPVFAGLRRLRDDLERARPGLTLPHLSMGMTNDYPIAIEEGATEVRVGRAIFVG
ncbi:MAG TPA: YggS family pyridoxal phosphate-dependent enzyme [Thermomicrobiales bacterium]|nr:YggS family pyridoxal phosphate-dependent enzyme [Thermomicrobiales bacterium]